MLSQKEVVLSLIVSWILFIIILENTGIMDKMVAKVKSFLKR